MAITPQDIEQLTFSPSKHGYNTEEVDAFLDRIAAEVDAMLNKIADLKGRLNGSEQQLAAAQAQVAQLREQNASAAAVSAAPQHTTGIGATEDQISRVLIVAQQSADKIVADARASADSIRTEADAKAREVIRQALAEKQGELDEIDRLKASREEFRAEYKKLLQHFIDDADAVFPQATLSQPNGSAAAAAPAAPAIPAEPAPAPSALEATVYAPNGGFDEFGDLD